VTIVFVCVCVYVCVCLSVCEHISPELHVQSLPIVLCIRRGSSVEPVVEICYTLPVFLDDVMFAHNSRK